MWFGRSIDEDWVDRVNGFWSVLVVTLCSLGAFLIRYITHPMSCYVPPQFSSSITRHATDCCFMRDNFYLPITDTIPKEHWPSDVTSYHLWIPLILFIQALCFKIPHILWTVGKRHLLFNVDETIGYLHKAELLNTENRKSMFQKAARVLDSLLKRNSFLLGALYLVVKLMFLLNLLGQFVFVTLYFRNELLVTAGSYINFNFDSYIKPILIKIGLCDLTIRQTTNKQMFTLQCVFPITEIYEKMYVFLWYWIFFVGVATFLNLLLWAGFIFFPFLRNSKISAYINAAPGPAKDSSSISRFISNSLGLNGVFLMSMISQNSSEMVAARLSQDMYEVFLQKEQDKPDTPTEAHVIAQDSEAVAMVNIEETKENDEKESLA